MEKLSRNGWGSVLNPSPGFHCFWFLLCLDEPAAGLNPKESNLLSRLLIDIKQHEKIAILLIEHDMSVVMEILDHIVVIDYGRKISDGTPNQIRNDPKVIAAYLGVDETQETSK